MDQNPQEEAQQYIVNWAKQTIAFAMSIRAERLGKPIDEDPELVALAAKEARELVKDLWREAFEAAPQPPAIEKVTWRPFVRKVFDWANDHLSSETTRQ